MLFDTGILAVNIFKQILMILQLVFNVVKE